MSKQRFPVKISIITGENKASDRCRYIIQSESTAGCARFVNYRFYSSYSDYLLSGRTEVEIPRLTERLWAKTARRLIFIAPYVNCLRLWRNGAAENDLCAPPGEVLNNSNRPFLVGLCHLGKQTGSHKVVFFHKCGGKTLMCAHTQGQQPVSFCTWPTSFIFIW